MAVTVQHQIRAAQQLLEQSRSERQLASEWQGNQVGEHLWESLDRRREDMMVEQHHSQRVVGGSFQRRDAACDHAVAQCTMASDEEAIVGRRRVDPHQVQPRVVDHIDATVPVGPTIHHEGGDVVAQTIVVAGHQSDAVV
jgi:hypothetical protein